MFDRRPCRDDLQSDATARISLTGQAKAPCERHRLAVYLQMGALVVLKDSQDELRAIRAAIILKSLCEGRRSDGRRDEHRCTEN
jgi:hypothetical protein